MYTAALTSALLLLSVNARDIVFPPVAGVESEQFLLGQPNKIDITSGSQFSGLTTFARIPYVNCFVDSEAESTPYDIAILGAPFDTVRSHIALLAFDVQPIIRNLYSRASLLARVQDTDPGGSALALVASRDGTSTPSRMSSRAGRSW